MSTGNKGANFLTTPTCTDFNPYERFSITTDGIDGDSKRYFLAYDQHHAVEIGWNDVRPFLPFQLDGEEEYYLSLDLTTEQIDYPNDTISGYIFCYDE